MLNILRVFFQSLTYLKSVIPMEAQKLMDYIKNTLVHRFYKKVGNGRKRKLKLRKMIPLIPPVIWNVLQTTKLLENRINNVRK